MKKTFTYLVIIIFCNTIIAQNSPYKIKNGDVSSITPKNMISGNEVLSNLITNTNPNTIASKTMSMDEVLIGTTTYDLQSNASVDNRLIRHNDGTISATWTMSAQYAAAYSDRGTGYNFYDGLGVYPAQSTQPDAWSKVPFRRRNGHAHSASELLNQLVGAGYCN